VVRIFYGAQNLHGCPLEPKGDATLAKELSKYRGEQNAHHGMRSADQRHKSILQALAFLGNLM